MKKLVMFFVLIMLVPSAFADWFYNSEHITTNINIYSEAEVAKTAPSGHISSATINLTFYPKETGTQELLKFNTNPEAESTNKTLKFSWKNPEGKISFGVDADVKTTNSIIPVDKKISFPIEQLPNDIAVYTKPSATIDSGDEGIIRLANELVKGDDDLYSAVFKVAYWTKNNIEYNLSTLTADVSQKASWVLQNKQGVCDELTSLFIALLRAVSVPARFVSGIAYTNSNLFPENWGAHGWAEVYFPDYGWVPFDVTYGEFGWVDPTHIKFKDSVDSDEPSTYYEWLGRNANLKTKKLDIKTSLIEKTGYSAPPIGIEVSTFKKAVSPGSYNLVEAVIENDGYFYYANELYLNKPKEVKILGENSKSILLLPRERRTISWIVKVDNNLDNKYSYTFPIVVSTMNNITSQANFTSSSREIQVPLDEVRQLEKLLEEEKQKKYSGNVLLNCNTLKNEFYDYEDAKVYCTAKNTRNVFLENLNACFDSQCSKLNLGILQTKNFTFNINKSISGERELPVILSNELVSKTYYINFRINDKPDIGIEELEMPANVSYGKNFTISFTLAKKSRSNPKNVDIAFIQNSVEKKWSVKELAESRKFALNFDANQLVYGKNDYKINVDYDDGLQKEYKSNKSFSIEFTNANILQRMRLSLNTLEGISYGEIALILLTGTIMFTLVVWWLFRKGKL